jgi:hypothetical protein
MTDILKVLTAPIMRPCGPDNGGKQASLKCLVDFYETTRRNMPEDNYLYIRHLKILLITIILNSIVYITPNSRMIVIDEVEIKRKDVVVDYF